jgi:hypothetical protein
MALFTLCLLFGKLHAFAADVIYIDRPNGQLDTRQQFETAASFYGLNVNTKVLDNSREVSAALYSIRSPKTAAIVISADTLSALSQQQVFALLHQRKQGIPLLIAGINEHTSPALLKQWSSGAIVECQRSALAPVAGWYEVANANDVTRQLSGKRLPLNQRDVFYLTLGTASKTQRLMEARFGGASMLVFVRVAIDGQDVFFATEKPTSNIPVTPDPYRQQDVFAAIAAPMMFLRYAGGERVWHTPGDYANLTIDDLWLREPYGHVNYESLLQEAEQHDYHATIAFIPWNFDRSEPKMVSLFQAHPDRLSICVHGNNHVHQEFGPFDSHPLGKQSKDIEQSLARMEKFKQLTNIPYDAVMVFPHSISPEATFSALKGTNFLATANSLNVPSDAKTPSDVEFALRTATLHFANFPSLRRYSAETDIPKLQLAIDAFLGNPMLFYAHESFFASGIDAFNKTADEVNQIQPDMQWRGLGDIAKHLYLERLRDDGNFDVRTFSGSIRLSNSHRRDAAFFIEKDEDFAFSLIVLVDGQPYPFQKAGTQLRLQVPIAGGMSRLIEIKYGSGLKLASIDTSKESSRIAAIRLLSDFRDNVVSNTALGRWFIHSYVDYGSRWNRAMAALALFIVIFFAWHTRRGRKVSSVSANLPLPWRSNQP